MNTVYYFFLFFFMPMLLCGQTVVTEKNAPKSIIKLYKSAQKCVDKKEIGEAIEKLEKAVEKEPAFIDAHLQLGGLYYSRGEYKQAIDHFSRAEKLDADYNVRVFQALAQSYEAVSNYEQASSYYEKYLSKDDKVREDYKKEVERKIRDFEFRTNAIANPVPFSPTKLSVKINSDQYSEYLPSLTADSERIFFTRVTQNQEDIYYSEKDSIGQWIEAVMLPNLNTLENEGAHSISANGKTILFTSCTDGRNGGPRGCNIYAAFKRGGNWSKPAFFDAINSKAWDSQPTISADGQIIVFASRRKGGKGGSDLWWTKRNENGRWSKPENMDSIINTTSREESPFLHPDGKTLYFKSDGHPGMGSFDLFKSKLNDDGSWSTPLNLGYPINTEDHEGALIVALDGKTAYYSRGDGDVGFDKSNTDIYTFTLPDIVSAYPVGFANIKVVDAETLEVLAASVNIQSSQGQLRSINTDQEGESLIILPIGENFSINIDKEGYYFHSERFELVDSNATSASAFEVTIPLSKIVPVKEVAAEPVILKNVLFETGSYDLKSESYFELDNLVRLLNQNPGLKIEIRGHTDDVGDDGANQILSEKRARSVYDFLIKNEIDGTRLNYVGLGETQPIASNETEEGRQMNRRTEFLTLSNG